MDSNVFWDLAFTLAVFGALGVWFFRCGHAGKARRVRAFAKQTLLYAGGTFLVGLSLLNSDLATVGPILHAAMATITFGCTLLLYCAAWAMTAADDESLEWVNLTGRALVWTSERDLGPFYTLPALQRDPATVLPPTRPRTNYVVSLELGRIGAETGRTDFFVAELAALPDSDVNQPLLIRRLTAVSDGLTAENRHQFLRDQ